MKQKTKYIIGLVGVFFVGVVATTLAFHFFPILQSEDIVKTVKEVSVKETDTIKSAVDKVYDSVLVIKSYQGNRLIGTGTGFVYKKENKKGYIITNHHVIEGASSVKVENMNGQVLDAKILGSDEISDLAVLSMDESGVLQVATLGDSTKLELGDTLFTVGSPMGEEYKGTVTKGILSGKDRTVSVDVNNNSFMMEVLQTDAAINPGNSGGPLVNINGEVIGVNSMKLVKDEIEGMGFAIPIEIVKTELDKLEKGEKITRPIIGVSVVDADNTYALYYNEIILDDNFEEGVVVASVEDGYPASIAGLKKGDVIVEVNGTKIKNSAHFRYVLYKYEVGDTITLRYYRDGKAKEVDLKLTEGIE